MRQASLLGALALLGLLVSCGDSTDTSSTGNTSSSAGTGAGPQCLLGDAEDDPPPTPTLSTPRWAFEPWISKDISTGTDSYDFVKGFKDRNIPVGVLVLDSPWETNYNTYVPNPSRYPDFTKMVSDMHAQDVRVVLWTTAFYNANSYDLEDGGDTYAGEAPGWSDAVDCGFFIDSGRTYSWWKGSGSSIDFSNPKALAWWHRKQDSLFDTGFDGYKLDFGDSYVTSDPVQTMAGPVPHQQYSEAYYHDYFAYARQKRGADFLALNRAYDTSYGFPPRFFSKPEDSPAAWMGDNRRDDVGLQDALDEMFHSAKAGYAVLGSDIGGYLDRDDLDLTKLIPFDPDNFARWTAVGALSPFMELHSRSNLTPWSVEQTNDEITNNYRYWASLHHELVPFFYSLTKTAYAGGKMPVQPIGGEKDWPGDYRYQLGDALLVAYLDETHARSVPIPAGKGAYDFYDPSSAMIPAGTTEKYSTDVLGRIPLYFLEGAIVPMNVSTDVTGFGDASSAGALTVAIVPSATQSSFVLSDEDDAETNIDAKQSAGGFTVDLSRSLRPTILRVHSDAAPTTVTAGGTALTTTVDRAGFDAAGTGYFFDATLHLLWIKVGKSSGKVAVVAS